MFHKIRSVAPLDNRILLIHFSNGIAKRYDMHPLFLEQGAFAPLAEDTALFNQVAVDVGGYGISWNDDIDLDCEELWANGIEETTTFTGLLSFADATTAWGLNESTLRKAINYGKLKAGIDVMKFGKQWVVTKEAMIREYGSITD